MRTSTYKTAEEAAVVYNRYAIEYYGEYASLNDVDMSIEPVQLGKPRKYKETIAKNHGMIITVDRKITEGTFDRY